MKAKIGGGLGTAVAPQQRSYKGSWRGQGAWNEGEGGEGGGERGGEERGRRRGKGGGKGGGGIGHRRCPTAAQLSASAASLPLRRRRESGGRGYGEEDELGGDRNGHVVIAPSDHLYIKEIFCPMFPGANRRIRDFPRARVGNCGRGGGEKSAMIY